MAEALAADAVLLGAVGGPKWDRLPFEKKPERGLLRLRKDMELFANLRPAVVFDALVDASTLKPEIVRGLDIMIVRELTGGVYFGEPRGIADAARTAGAAASTRRSTRATRSSASPASPSSSPASGRAGCARSRSPTSWRSGVLWREEVQALHDAEFPTSSSAHMYADNCAMQLVRDPKQFDVIVTDNLFGDMLSDEAAMLTGSLGMLPSASLGAADAQGRRRALYEPVHGSAPDIAGRGHRQSAGHAAQLRDVPALFVRPATTRRTCSRRR